MKRKFDHTELQSPQKDFYTWCNRIFSCWAGPTDLSQIVWDYAFSPAFFISQSDIHTIQKLPTWNHSACRRALLRLIQGKHEHGLFCRNQIQDYALVLLVDWDGLRSRLQAHVCWGTIPQIIQSRIMSRLVFDRIECCAPPSNWQELARHPKKKLKSSETFILEIFLHPFTWLHTEAQQQVEFAQGQGDTQLIVEELVQAFPPHKGNEWFQIPRKVLIEHLDSVFYWILRYKSF